MHILSSPLPSYPFGGVVITLEGVEDYVDNAPITDSLSLEEPFNDEEDDTAVMLVCFVVCLDC